MSYNPEYHKQYRQKNAEKAKAYNRQYSKDNAAKKKANYKKWVIENPEKMQSYRDKWLKNNPDSAKEAYKKYRDNNPEKRKLSNKKWKDNNLEAFKHYQVQYEIKNKHKKRARTAKYRALKLQRTPKWADLKAIELFYKNCPEGYHVDHIVPLQGKLVSGLHILNNLQYLLGIDNLKKYNKFEIQIGYN